MAAPTLAQASLPALALISSMTWAQAVPPEFQVNTSTTDYQYDSTVAALDGGGFIVVWHDNLLATVIAQRFTSGASKVGGELTVPVEGTLGLTTPGPDVGALAAGGAVVAWTGAEDDVADPASEVGVAAQVLDGNGVKLGTEFHVNTTTTGTQTLGGVAALTGGGFVVTWESAPLSGGVGQDGSGKGIYARRFNADGSPASGEFKVNTITTGDQKGPRIAALSNGGFVIVWRNENPTTFLAQRYSANGSAVGGEVTIKSGSAQSYDVAGLTGGGFVVIWSDGAGGAGMEVYGRQFDASGSPLAGEFPVNTFSAGGQISSAVAGLADGGYVMLWHSDGQDGGGLGVYGRKYLASGAADGGEFPVNVRTADIQAFAAAAALGNGFVVTWTSDKQDGSFYGIFGRLFGDTGGGGSVIEGTPDPDNLIGTTGNDTINGKGGADVMTGLAGNDIYIVNTAGDEVVEAAGEGTDTVKSAVSYTLPIHVENLVLTGAGSINGTGNGLDNTLTGNDASNVLNGKAGADKMFGRGGDDIYYVDNAGDTVAEAADSGTDTVRSSVTYRLPKNVENLTLTGTAPNIGTGNGLANRITGNGANNVLNGGTGKDTLIGAAGEDRFLFRDALNATTNVDRLPDFAVIDDKIRLENAVFTALTATGTLAASAFRAAGTASAAAHRILYDPSTGALLYDADGTGPATSVRFATLPTGLALTNANFVVQ